MIPEIGIFSLILAAAFAFLLALVPSFGLIKKDPALMATAPWYVGGQCFFVALAYLCLTLSFLQNDFTLLYVSHNSSTLLPWFYKICAVWGGHEGSMLLWILILNIWTMAVLCFGGQLEETFRVRVLVVLGALNLGFLLFLLMTSDPFLRSFQDISQEGRDLNPLLQDPGFLFHPPMLYMGYVGFSIAFAFAISALWMGKMEAAWVRWTRPWILAAWCFLTLGITLGSWWAYRELGWGGWWFWDPVENASFMPWLVGTALVHSLMVSEKRQQFMAWTLLLALTAFALSLIGTFLVRSGVLTSVHAFAVDPERGIYILSFLFLVIGGSLLLFSLRAHRLKQAKAAALLSRETALLLNNVFLVVMMLTVLLGTIYPLLVEALGLGKLSVGAPYFNAVFVPLMLPFLFLMGAGVHLQWQSDSLKKVIPRLAPALLLSLGLPFLLLYLLTDEIKFYGFLGLALAFWIILNTLQLLGKRLLLSQKSLSLAFLGMVFAHLGIAVTLIGITISSNYGLQDDVKMSLGEVKNFAGFKLLFEKELPLKGPNYHGTVLKFELSQGTETKALKPEKRIYDVGNMMMTEAAVDAHVFRDLYIAAGEPLSAGTWSLRLYYKPFIRWIWAGGFMVFIGGLLALFNRPSSKGPLS